MLLHIFLHFQFIPILFLVLLLPFISIYQCIFKKNSKNPKSPSPAIPGKDETKKSSEIKNDNLALNEKESSEKKQKEEKSKKSSKELDGKKRVVAAIIPNQSINQQPESENIIPVMCIRPPNDASEHVKAFYESGEAQNIMQAELVAFEEMDKTVRLELFARVVHYIDSKLQSRGVNFSTVPPIVPESAKEWALSRGMPPILRARTEMLIEYENFMCLIPDNLNHLPPDGSLNTVYKHAMREEIPFIERMELLDELFSRTCNNVAQKWCLILTQKIPYPALGRAYRRNPQIFKEYKTQPKELTFSY